MPLDSGWQEGRVVSCERDWDHDRDDGSGLSPVNNPGAKWRRFASIWRAEPGAPDLALRPALSQTPGGRSGPHGAFERKVAGSGSESPPQKTLIIKAFPRAYLPAGPESGSEARGPENRLDENARDAPSSGASFWGPGRPLSPGPASLARTVPLGAEGPPVPWGVSRSVRGGKAAFDKYKTPSLSHFGIF